MEDQTFNPVDLPQKIVVLRAVQQALKTAQVDIYLPAALHDIIDDLENTYIDQRRAHED